MDDISDESLTVGLETGRLFATTDFSRLAMMDVMIIAVPTPITWNRLPEAD